MENKNLYHKPKIKVRAVDCEDLLAESPSYPQVNRQLRYPDPEANPQAKTSIWDNKLSER